VPIISSPLFEGKSTFDNYGNIFNGSIMAKRFCLAPANPNGAKLKKSHRNGVPQRIRKRRYHKDVINTFDQITLLNEVEKLINDSEKRLQTETKRI
jgi:hypothetical protein